MVDPKNPTFHTLFHQKNVESINQVEVCFFMETSCQCHFLAVDPFLDFKTTYISKTLHFARYFT